MASTIAVEGPQAIGESLLYARKKIEKCQVTWDVICCSFSILPDLWMVKRSADKASVAVGKLQLDSVTDEDRQTLWDLSHTWMDVAKRIEVCDNAYRDRIRNSLTVPVVTRHNLRLFDYAFCRAEDVAETLALVASTDVMESLKRDLTSMHGSA